MKSVYLSPLSFASLVRVSAVVLWRLVVQRGVQARRHRRDVAVLSQLDDHQLKDIGLTRGQIEDFAAARSPRGTAPGCRAPAHRRCDAAA